MKSKLSVAGKSGLGAFYSALKCLVDRCRLTVAFHQRAPVPVILNREKILSVDTFGFSQTKWGWNYTRDPATGIFFPQDAVPFCPRCEVPMQHNGNPFLEAFCPECEARDRYPYHQVLLSRCFVLVEITKRYPPAEVPGHRPAQNTPALGTGARSANQACVPKDKIKS